MIKILILLFFSSVSFAGYGDYEGAKSLSFSQLQSMLEGAGSENVEQALLTLKEKNPEFFTRYILMYRSRSLQQSSYLAPRALLVGPAAKLVISFNGDPSHRGYQNLEVMEYFDEGQRFEFREISFKKGKGPIFSKANPQRCLVCHQNSKRTVADPRPNWEPYSLWPGAYGSNGNMKFNGERFKHDDRLRKEDHQFYQDHINEEANYKKFAETVKNQHQRYQLLEEFRSELTVNFTETLLSHNYRRVVRLAKNTPYYEKYKFAFLAAASCRHIPWPEDFERWHTANNPRPERIRKDAPPSIDSCELGFSDGMGRISQQEIKKICREMKERKPKYRARQISESISDIFESTGVDTSDWSTDFRTEGGRFAFKERFGLPSNPVDRMRTAMREVEPELSKLSCKEMESKSLQVLTDFAHSGGFFKMQEGLLARSAEKPASILKTCMKCHSDPDESWVPQIPYGDPEKLKEFIAKVKFPRGNLIDEVTYRTGAHSRSNEQMPPSQVVTGAQRKELIEYLKGFL